MGQVLKKLSENAVPGKPVFDKRFVVEICETVHVHYRNLRLNLSLPDFLSMAQGMADSLERWAAMGSPEPNKSKHIELCRKPVGEQQIGDDSAKVSLNTNLYLQNQGRIFSKGAELTDPVYIHLKLRDLRLELTLDEFSQLQKTVAEAAAQMNLQEETAQA